MLNPEQMFPQYKDAIVEKIPFNPNREKITPEEAKKIQELLDQFPFIFTDMIIQSFEAKTGSQAAKDQEIVLGQIAGKVALRCTEGMPVRTQEKMVQNVLGLERSASAANHFNDGSFMAGWMGEFCTGVLLDESGLEINFPEATEDLYQKNDLQIILPNGREAHIQSKTISAPLEYAFLRRDNFEAIHLPVFSCLETPADTNQFIDILTKVNDHKDNRDGRLIKRIDELALYAQNMHKQAQTIGYIPIISLLFKPGRPDTEISDIIMTNCRPTPVVSQEAKLDLDIIRQRYR